MLAEKILSKALQSIVLCSAAAFFHSANSGVLSAKEMPKPSLTLTDLVAVVKTILLGNDDLEKEIDDILKKNSPDIAYAAYQLKLGETPSYKPLSVAIRGNKSTLFTLRRINPTLEHPALPKGMGISSNAKELLKNYVANKSSFLNISRDPEFKTFEYQSGKTTYLIQPAAAWLLEYIATFKAAARASKEAAILAPAKRPSDPLDENYERLHALIDSVPVIKKTIKSAVDIFETGIGVIVSIGSPIAPYSSLFLFLYEYLSNKRIYNLSNGRQGDEGMNEAIEKLQNNKLQEYRIAKDAGEIKQHLAASVQIYNEVVAAQSASIAAAQPPAAAPQPPLPKVQQSEPVKQAVAAVQDPMLKSDLRVQAKKIQEVLATSIHAKEIKDILSLNENVLKAYNGELSPSASVIAILVQESNKKYYPAVFTEARIHPTLDGLHNVKDILLKSAISESAKKDLLGYIDNDNLEPQELLSKPEFKTYQVKSNNDDLVYLIQTVAGWLLEYVATVKAARRAYSNAVALAVGTPPRRQEIDQLFPTLDDLKALVNTTGRLQLPIKTEQNIFDTPERKLSFIVSKTSPTNNTDPIFPYSALFKAIVDYKQAKNDQKRLNELRRNVQYGTLSLTNMFTLKTDVRKLENVKKSIDELIKLFDSTISPQAAAAIKPVEKQDAASPEQVIAAPIQEPVKQQKPDDGPAPKQETRVTAEEFKNLLNKGTLTDFPPELQPLVKPYLDAKQAYNSLKNYDSLKKTEYYQILGSSIMSYGNYLLKSYK